MAADGDDDMEWLDCEEQMQYPKSDEEIGEYEFTDLEKEKSPERRRQPDFQSVGRLFPNIVSSRKYVSEALHVRCRSPRRNADSIIWKAVLTIIQGARSAFGAEGWRIGMSASEMKKIDHQEEKLNQMRCPR